MAKWEYDGQFLKQFSAYERNIVTQLFCEGYRGKAQCYSGEPHEPAASLVEMLDRIEKWATEGVVTEWFSQERKIACRKVVEQINTDELKNFARFIAERERIPETQKQELRLAAKEEFVNKAMQQKQPSAKQLALLEKLGVKVMPQSMAEASALIDKHLNKKAA